MTAEMTIPGKLFRFVKEHTNNYYSLHIILLFANHPFTRFNELAIIHAIHRDGSRLHIQKALRELVDKGILTTRIDSNVHLYSLPENMRSVVLELAKLDLLQQQQLLGQTSQNSTGKGGCLCQQQTTEMLPGIPEAIIAGSQCSPISNQKKL